jgi:putative hemolysin
MKQLITISLMILAVFIAGCAPNNSNVACTMEAKLCPDGSAVGRVGPNCEFAACPTNANMANPASVYCEEHNGTLQIIDESDGQRGICILSDGTRCEEWAYFRGECLDIQHQCTTAQKNAQACTLEYAPVCGWFNQTIQCFKYPCAATYGNKCQACADAKVAYWTNGECPA